MNYPENAGNLLNVPLTNEGIKEVLGFFHHELSQQSKEIGIINRRLSQIITSSPENDETEAKLFIEATNRRIDNISLSIESLTQQVLMQENTTKSLIQSMRNSLQCTIDENIKRIETRINEIQKATDNSVCFQEIFNLKIKEAIEEQLQEKFDVIDQVILELKEENANINAETATRVSKTPTTKSGKKRPLSSQRIKKIANHPSLISNNQMIFDAAPSNQIQSQDSVKIIQIQTDIEKLKEQINESSQPTTSNLDDLQLFERMSKLIKENENEINSSFQNVHSRIDDCATKNELFEIVQGFIASGAEGVAEVHMKKQQNSSTRNLSSEKTNRSMEFGPINIIKQTTPRKSAHITLITGDYLKRPPSQHIIKQGTFSKPKRL